jgi:hypothetical protein
LAVGTSGLYGYDVQWCDSGGCTTLTGGDLRLAPTLAACIAVLGITDVCADF